MLHREPRLALLTIAKCNGLKEQKEQIGCKLGKGRKSKLGSGMGGSRARRVLAPWSSEVLGAVLCWESSAAPEVSPAVYLPLKRECLKINKNRLSKSGICGNQKLG